MSQSTNHDGVDLPYEWSLPPADVFFNQTELTAHLRSGGSRTIAKACSDPWRYAIGLRTGAVIVYERAELRGQWLWLADAQFLMPRLAIESRRGIEVRLDSVAWHCDQGH